MYFFSFDKISQMPPCLNCLCAKLATTISVYHFHVVTSFKLQSYGLLQPWLDFRNTKLATTISHFFFHVFTSFQTPDTEIFLHYWLLPPWLDCRNTKMATTISLFYIMSSPGVGLQKWKSCVTIDWIHLGSTVEKNSLFTVGCCLLVGQPKFQAYTPFYLLHVVTSVGLQKSYFTMEYSHLA
jgi:hypothetical protein